MQNGAEEAQGYSIHRDVFTRAEMIRVQEAIDASALSRSKAGVRHMLRVPAVRAIASDRRLLAIAARYLDATPVPFRATLFDKSPTSNWLVAWHQDTALPLCQRVANPEWGPWSEKSGVLYAHAPAWALERVIALRVHLDDSTPLNGPLRVLPQTHSFGVLSDERVTEVSHTVTAVDCLAPAGGVVAMRPLIVHASSKVHAGDRRRVLHIEYATSMRLAGGIELAQT